MDPEPSGQELVSTGSLASASGPPRRRPWAVVLVAAGLLVAAVLVQQRDQDHPAATPARPSAAAASPGPAYVIRSDGGTGRIRVVDVQRVRTAADQSALGLILRLEVSAGTQTVTTDSFVVSDPDGTMTRASGLTVLVPGSSVVPSESGFRITAPAAVDLEIVVPVPAGVHVLSVVSQTQQTLAGFSVTG